jgi:oligopeptide transport system substrate-binding protein
MRHPPFSDERLRRAVSLCIDRELLVDKVYKDGSVAATHFVPNNIANYHNTARLDFADWPMEKRRDEARRLLAEAGYGPDHPLKVEFKMMTTNSGRRQGVAMSAMLKQCGIIGQLFFNEAKVYYAALQQFDFTLAWAGWVADFNDPYNFLYLFDSRSGAYNYPGYKNPAYDALMDQAQQTLDIEKRAALLAQAEQMGLNDSAMIPLSSTSYRMLVGPQVKGYVDNPTNVHRTRWMRIERDDQ